MVGRAVFDWVCAFGGAWAPDFAELIISMHEYVARLGFFRGRGAIYVTGGAARGYMWYRVENLRHLARSRFAFRTLNFLVSPARFFLILRREFFRAVSVAPGGVLSAGIFGQETLGAGQIFFSRGFFAVKVLYRAAFFEIIFRS